MERNPVSLNQEQIQAWPPAPTVPIDQVVEQPTVSVDTGAVSVPLPDDVVAMRSAKANYGLGGVVDKTYDDYYKAITNGQEYNVRSEVASQMDIQRYIHLQDQITAAARQGDTENISNAVKGNTPTDPKSIFEDAFSVKFVNSIYNVGGPENSWFEDAQRQIPEEVRSDAQDASVYSSKIEYLRTLREDVQAEADQQSWLGWGVDQLKSLTQFYPEAKLRGLQGGVEGFKGLGSNLEEQALIRLRQPYGDFKTNITNDIAKLRKDNPQLALQYLDAMIGQSSSEKNLNNAFTLMAIPDIATGLGLAKKAIVGSVLRTQTRTAFKDVIKQVANAEKRPIEVAAADATGNLDEAAVKQASVDATKDIAGKGNPVKETVEQLPDLIRVDIPAMESRPGRFGQEIVNRIKEASGSFKERLISTIENIQKVERISSPQASEEAVRAIKEDIRGQYRGMDNTILNISDPIHDTTTNTYHVQVNTGTANAQMFGTAEDAFGHAQLNGLSGYQIKPDGFGYYLQFKKPLNETTNAVRDYLLATKISQTPDSWLNAFTSWLRTPEETMSFEQRMNRKIATYAPSELMKVAKETAGEIQKLAKWTIPGTPRVKRWNDFERILKSARDDIHPDTGEKGYFVRSPGELEEKYMKLVGRLPEKQEIEAYFAFTRIVEMDYALRNLQAYKFASRVGAEQHQIWTIGADGKRINSGFFNGVNRKLFPGGEDTVLVVGDKVGQEKLYIGGHGPDSKALKKLREEVETGERKVVEVHAPENRPLQGFGKKVGDARVRYVIVRSGSAESKPLSLQQIPRREGGHFDYDYEHYVKQANIRPERIGDQFKVWYEGDTTVMPISVRSMGVDVARKLDAVREAIKAKDMVAAEAHAKSLGIPFNDVKGWFFPKKDKKGIIQPPKLNLDEPFRVVPQNKSIIDLDKDIEKRYMNNKIGTTYLNDGTKRGSINQQYQIAYTGQRDSHDVFTLNNTGTHQNPLYALEQAKLVDPIPSMNRAISKITQSTFMDDYKIQAIEHWLREASTFLKAEDSELRYSPFYHFQHPEFKGGVDMKDKSQLMANWHKINQFTGIASSTNAMLHSASQALADSVYNKFGPKGLKIIPTWALADKDYDPIRWTRSVVFNMKMGLFSVPQFLVHAMTYVNVMGIAGPVRSGQGALGAMLHMWGSLNRSPAILDHLDNIASKMGIFKPGEWKEANAELLKTGFINEAGEYALRDDLYSNKVVSSGTHSVLESGQMFFRGGVRSLRAGSWYTAYKEWRELNPTGAITNLERGKILERADILSHNMTRASNSMLHTGIMSIPAQFYTYFLRLAELTMGSRLTGAERARLLGVNMLAFGIPTALGITGLPFDTMLRKAAQDNGYVVGDNFLNDLMTNGIPAAVGAIITGNSDPHKGIWFNVADRYGPKGMQMLDDALNRDKSIWEWMGGAMYSTLANEWAQSSGLRMAAMSGLKGDGKAFPFHVDDVLDLLKEVASVNYAFRAIGMASTGRLLSKNETLLKDNTSVGEAMLSFFTGLSDQKVGDEYTKATTRKEEKAFMQYVGNKFEEEFKRGLREGNNNNPEQAKRFFTRAFQYLEQFGYPEEKRASLIAEASKDDEALIDRMDWEYYLKDVPEYRKATALDAFRRQVRLQQEAKQ